MRRFLAILILVAALCLAGGYLLGNGQTGSAAAAPAAVPVFHDLRVNSTGSYLALIAPESPEVARLARRFKSYQEAYRFVSEEIGFAPFVPPGPVDQTLRHGVGSCLGKAVLLCSLYRAMGMPAQDLRIVMGLVNTPDGLAEHVWIDLEHQGRCLQQDPSGMLGRFAFDAFPGTAYVERYVVKENFCFNEADFAIVSQLNRFRTAAR